MLNQITLLGNLGTDAEMRFTQSGIPVTHFDLAVNRVWTDDAGEKQEKTVWVRVTCWRKLAETCGEHLSKGRQVLVIGELEEASAFIDKEGNARASNEVTARRVVFLGGGNGDASAETDAAGSVAADEQALPNFG